MEKIVETTRTHYIEIMEKNMETTITAGYIGFRVQNVHVGAVFFSPVVVASGSPALV